MLHDVMAKWHIAGGDWFHRQPPLPAVNGLRAAGSRASKNRKKKGAKEPQDDDAPAAAAPAAAAGPSTPASTSEVSAGDVATAGAEGGYVNGEGLDVTPDEPGETTAADRAGGGGTTKLLDHGRLLRLAAASLEDLDVFHQHWQGSLPVLVTRPRSWFRSDIWRPSTLARCGGSPAVDGVTGVDVPAARFWDQFEHGLRGAANLRLKV